MRSSRERLAATSWSVGVTAVLALLYATAVEGEDGVAMGVRRPLARRQRLAIVNGMLAFALMLVILQAWLLPATNANLGRDTTGVRPAAVAGVPCLLLNAGLLRYLYQLDRDHR